MYKEVLKQIKKYDKIVIGRHIGPDPDCLASQLALRETILEMFPNKKVYAIGAPASKFKFLGKLNKLPENFSNKDALAIILDTPDRKRIDSVDVEKYDYSIKIDHHPFIEKTTNLEIIDANASSTAQLILEMIFYLKLPLTKNIGETLYVGIVADTNRFLFDYTSAYTFEIVSKLLNTVDIDLGKLYNNLYLRPLNELRFLGYIEQNLIVNEDKFAYIKLTDAILAEYKVDPSTAGNMINDFNYIKEFVVWCIFSEEVKNEIIRVGVRSRGPQINDVLEKYKGGGHYFAAGARIKTFEQADEIIKLLEKRCKDYIDEEE
jgi:phosphoesterase RecJ-like protein